MQRKHGTEDIKAVTNKKEIQPHCVKHIATSLNFLNTTQRNILHIECKQ